MHGFIFYKMTIFTSVHFINVETLLCILIIIAKLVSVHKIDWKDNRNISLKSSSAQILILKSTNFQKYVNSKLLFFSELNPLKPHMALSCKQGTISSAIVLILS